MNSDSEEGGSERREREKGRRVEESRGDVQDVKTGRGNPSHAG